METEVEEGEYGGRGKWRGMNTRVMAAERAEGKMWTGKWAKRWTDRGPFSKVEARMGGITLLDVEDKHMRPLKCLVFCSMPVFQNRLNVYAHKYMQMISSLR